MPRPVARRQQRSASWPALTIAWPQTRARATIPQPWAGRPTMLREAGRTDETIAWCLCAAPRPGGGDLRERPVPGHLHRQPRRRPRPRTQHFAEPGRPRLGPPRRLPGRRPPLRRRWGNPRVHLLYTAPPARRGGPRPDDPRRRPRRLQRQRCPHRFPGRAVRRQRPPPAPAVRAARPATVRPVTPGRPPMSADPALATGLRSPVRLTARAGGWPAAPGCSPRSPPGSPPGTGGCCGCCTSTAS
jgi:hypothetical protein